MWLTNTEADGLRILPTHRLIKNLDNYDEAAVLRKLEKNSKIKPAVDASDIHEFILGKEWTFGLIFKDDAYAVRLKPEAFPTLKMNSIIFIRDRATRGAHAAQALALRERHLNFRHFFVEFSRKKYEAWQSFLPGF